jgi:hypothetical protein
VRPAGHRVARDADGTLPERWLIAQWPDDQTEPVKYWLSSLPATTNHADLVRYGKIRWRIEHDYRELNTGLGLDHFEGAPSPAGTATSPWSPRRTCSSPTCAWTQKRLRRPDPLHGHPRAATTPRDLDRHLPHLPPTRETATPRRKPPNLTKHY